MTKSFIEKLTTTIEHNNSLLCIGLDPDPKQISVDLAQWGQTIIEQTADLACCYKPNIAFYEQYGSAGLEALRQTIAAVPNDIPVLLDAKRGDIGHTAAAYSRAAFEVLGADAITVSPYLGQDGIAPFLAFSGKMVFVLCYTSNPSAKEIQEFRGESMPLFEHVAQCAQTWGQPEQIGFVVGATQPDALARVRNLAPDRWILAPGIGAQGGDLTAVLSAGLNLQGSGLIVPVSRTVLYAKEPRTEALALREEINQARQKWASSTQSKSDPLSKAWPITALIEQLYEVGCIQFGNFTLASGRQSPIYLDLRQITAKPSLLKLAAMAYAELLKPLSFDHLAAVPYAALTIGTAISLTINKPLIYPRKEIKGYGTGKSIEGRFAVGEKAVMIEDLVTSGGSVLKAIEQLEAAELVVEDVVVLIDREQGGAQALAQRGYRLHAALKLTEILETLVHIGRISAEQLNSCKLQITN